jgi:transposase
MWSNENRGRYDRSKLRYPSDPTDDAWALIAPLIPPARKGGAKRTVNLREVVNGLLYVLSTGCQWRALPKDLPPKSTADRHPGADRGIKPPSRYRDHGAGWPQHFKKLTGCSLLHTAVSDLGA